MKRHGASTPPGTRPKKTKWKTFFLWSSIGGVALGATVTLARRSRRSPLTSPDLRRIPDKCPQFAIWTERFTIEEEGRPVTAHDKYVLQETPFSVWSVLDRKGNKGAAIYHVTHLRIVETEDSIGEHQDERVLNRFYGTVRVIDLNGKRSAKDVVARGATLEISKCRVGGATNGVETGEVHYSFRPILNYRFEYTPIS